MRRILVVDDDVEILDYSKKLLEKNNYEVVTALDAKEGLDEVRKNKPDLIILDIIMPQKDGFAFLGELKKDDTLCTIPVIMLTAKTEMSYLRESKRYGVTDYFIKPINPEELLKYLRRYLG